jgi:hypothetical protein
VCAQGRRGELLKAWHRNQGRLPAEQYLRGGGLIELPMPKETNQAGIRLVLPLFVQRVVRRIGIGQQACHQQQAGQQCG